MTEYRIKIELKSDTLIGSGEGFGALIDSDIVFDELGIPYIPGKRIKGILRESYEEIIGLLIKNVSSSFSPPDDLFGKVGSGKETALVISNLYVKEYEDIRRHLQKLMVQHPEIFNFESVIEAYTSLRQQTAIDSDLGIAREHSLRTIRVLNRGICFFGKIIDSEDILKKDHNKEILALACMNIKRIGTQRTRGFGEVKWTFMEKRGSNWIELTDKNLGFLIKNKDNPASPEAKEG